MKSINRFFNDTHYAISWGIMGIVVVSLLLSIFLISQTIAVFDNDLDTVNSITVTGEGEVLVIPDIATFSFTAQKTAKIISAAQANINERMNNAIDFLKGEGVDEKDIKTISYNAYPRYEWVKETCIEDICYPGKQEMVGYEVSQTVSVKVREPNNIGSILDGIGSLDLDNISSLSFEVDDREGLQNQAREMAIQDAKEQAKVLAKELGVKIDDIISFSESNSPINRYGGIEELYSVKAVDAAIPTGQSQIKSVVHITFEIE